MNVELAATLKGHPAYRFMIPGRQKGGNALDMSGHGAHAGVSINLGVSAAWANTGYATVVAGNSKGFFVQKEKASFDLATQSVIFAITINKAAPSGTEVIFGNGNSGAGVYGFFVQAQSDGKIRPWISTSAGIVAMPGASAAVVCDGTPHHIALVIDGRTKSAFLYIDGVLDSVGRGLFSGTTSGMVSNLNIGSQGLAAGVSTGYDLKWRDAHLLVLDGGLPINIGQVVAGIAAQPQRIVEGPDLVFPTRWWTACWLGQSNEAESGYFADMSGDTGCPTRDVSARSMRPYLATLAGKRGLWLDMFNSAVGGTSIAHSWTGYVQTWASGLKLLQGSLILSDGGVWKVAGSGSFDGTVYTSTVAPTGTANLTTADGVVWTYLGAPTASDVSGRVLQSGDAHFDPNGYMARALAGVSTRVGFDEKWAFISIGQADATLLTTRAVFAAAHVSAANYFLAAGLKVAIGFTCYSAATGAEAQYQSDLLPGIADAQANFAGNANVKVGANLRTALGVLTLSGEYYPGLKPDTVHMNDPCLALASEAWDAAISAML